MLKEYLSGLANAFRAVLGTTEKINAQDFPDKVSEVYEKGYAQGTADNTPSVDPNWTDWRYMFAYNARADLLAKLKFTDTSKGKNFQYMFFSNNTIKEIPLIDISGASDAYGWGFTGMFKWCSEITTIPLDFENTIASKFDETFYGCTALIEAPKLNSSRAQNFTRTFYNCTSLVSVPKIDFSGNRYNSMTDTFYACSKLSHIGIEGTIKNKISFSSCPLEIETARNILRALGDNVGNFSVTFKSTVKTALLEDTETAPDGTTWAEWVINRGWTW